MEELPPGWTRALLGDVAEVLDHRRVPLNQAERAARPGPYPYYGANGQVGTVADFLFDGDHILLAEDGGYFDDPYRPNAYEVSGRFWVNNHAHILKSLPCVDRGYLLHILNATDLMPYVSGTTRLKLTQGDMRRIPIPLPPLAEQRRIVARIEALFARTRRARAELGRVEALADRYVEQALTAAFMPADGSNAEAVAIGDLLSEPPTNGISVRGADEPPGTPALRLDALGPDRLNLDRVRYIDIPPGTVQRLRVQEGDFFASRGNGSLRLLARGAFAGAPAKDTVFPDTMIRLRFNPGRVVPAWLKLAWSSRPVRSQVEAKAKTTAGIWKVSQSDLASIKIHLPDLDQQKSVAEQLGSDMAKVASSRRETTRALALLDRLDAAILARAFRGELVPQDPADEPAMLAGARRFGIAVERPGEAVRRMA